MKMNEKEKMANTKLGNRRRRASLRGTDLYEDKRNGVLIWRKMNLITGERIKRSTKTRKFKLAMQRAHQFEVELEREHAGLTEFQTYTRDIGPFVELFLKRGKRGASRAKALRIQLFRAFDLLKIRTLANITDHTKLERRLLALELAPGEKKTPGKFRIRTLVRGFQEPLKQFCKYLHGKKQITENHLASWALLDIDEETSPGRVPRRALSPDEMVGALAALDCLDAINKRTSPLSPVFEILLVSASRIGAMAALNIDDLNHDEKRLMLAGHGNKRAGAAMLDDETYKLVVQYVGNRTDEALFLSPDGKRFDHENTLDDWRDAVRLAIIDAEWPDDEPRDLMLEYYVMKALTTGKVSVARGGPRTGKNAPGPDKIAARERRAAVVSRVTDSISDVVVARMKGVDQHCLRMTHRTWAIMSGVSEVFIDRQLGHTSQAGEAVLKAVFSIVGRSRYTDMDMLIGNARRSADAVKGLLGRATADLKQMITDGKSALSFSKASDSGISRKEA